MFRPLAERPGTVSICPECNQPFKSANSPHAPLILHCGHLCCEECIRTALSTERVIMCKECNTTSTTKTSPDVKQSNLRDSFPLSEKMIEEINKLTQMKPVDESCIGFKSSKKLSIEKQSPNTSLHDDACGECHTIIAVLKCVDCKGTLFCEKCWARVHSFKTNQDHEYVNISSKPFKPLEKKPEYTKLLKEHHERLLKKQEKLECSIKIINNPALINDGKSSGMDMQQIGDDLKQFFMYCQNTIKSMENKVMKEYESIAYSLDHSQTKCYKELNHTRNEIVELAKQMYEISGNDFYDSSSVETLLAKSDELLEKPDMIMMNRPVSGSKGITLPSNEWITILNSQLNFDFGKAGEFKLVKIPLEGDSRSTPLSPMSTPCSNNADDSFENVYQDASLWYGEGARYQSNERRPSKTYSVHSVQLPLNSNSEYSKGDHRRAGSICDMECMNLAQRTSRIRGSNPTTPAQICGPSFSYLRMGPQSSRTCYDHKITKTRSNFGRQVRFREGWRGSVVISCIFTPSYFYVQLESGLLVLEKYRKFFMKADDHPAIDRANIKTGNMYLAHCSDGEWYRVRLSEVIPDEQLVQVTQIDTGKVEVVDMRKLRRIDDVMRSAAMDSELAIQCSIFDCYPMGTVWTREDNEAFVQILKDKRNITMLVKKVQTNKLEVDLIWNDKSSEISIRDFMLMSKTACLASRKDILNTTSAADNFKYFKDTEYQPKKCIDVKVTYVYGPDEFYVKRVDPISDKLFKRMNEGLDGFYKNNNHYKCYQVLSPVVGLPVAAQFSVDNLWYRAELLSINTQSKKAEVRYVDFGNKETLSFSRIRQLAKEYIRFSVQAVKCSLIGIKPINDNYISGCTNFLIKNVDDLVLKMIVEEVKGNQLDVILFRCNEDEDVCLNLLLVENRFAKRVGDVLGTVSSYPKRDGVRNSRPKSSTTVVEKPVEVAQVNTPKQTDVPVTEVESNDEVAESESMISSSEEITSEHNSEKSTKEEIKYEVKMVNFISPDRFYVTLTLHVNVIQQINNEMCKFYRDEKNSQELLMESVEKNAKCVAYSENHKKWNRAKVLEVKENGDIFLFYTDFGFEETVKLKDLRKLPEKFNKMCDGVVVCHMANIENRTNWPNRLCESLRTHLNDYSSLHITKVPKEPGKSTLPVELWGKILSFQGPFDPAIEEWTNVNQLLAKALQNNDPSELDSNDLRAERESVENVIAEIGEICSNESVKKWLYSSVEEATEKGIEFSEDVAKGKIPQERLISSKSPAKSISPSSKSTVSKTNGVEQEAGTSSGIPSRDWKLPEPIIAQEFDVMPTYINEEFCIYVQGLEKHDKIVIDMISKGLQSKFENTIPLPMDLHWYPGQICIAWFFLDKQWYRGRVLKVDGERAFVEYVDFGNTEWVEVIHLRKDIILEDFPIQCHKLPIRSDCKPLFEDGKWPTKILDLVHVTILERKCRIKLRKEKGEDFYRVEKLFLEDTGVELFDYLCQLGYATIAHSPAKRKEKKTSTSLNTSNLVAELENEAGDIAQSDSSSSIANVDSVSHLDFSELLEMPGVSNVINDPFNIPQNPHDNEIIVPYCELPVSELNIVTVQVIEILRMDEIVVHIVDCDNEAMDLNRNIFLEMTAELQVKGAEQPLLKSPSLGRMCCTKFDDDVWYRAKIIDCSDNEKVTILYVDYGNSSSVHPHELHEMKRSWFNVPIQSIRCQLIDYEIPNDMDEMLLKLINNEFEAVLESSGDPHYYKIKLFFK